MARSKEGKEEVTVGAASLKPKKKRIFGKILLTLVIGLCLGGVVMYYYLEIYQDNLKECNDNKDKVTTEEKSNEAVEKSLDINSYTVKRLINMMHFNEGTNEEKTLYVNNKTIAKDLTESYLDNLLMREAFRLNSTFKNSVSVADLEEARINLFGKNYEVIIPTDKEVGSCPTFKYDVDSRTYSMDDSKCSINNDIEIKYETTKATIKEKEKIEIYEAVIFIKDEKVYKTIDGSNNLSDEVKDVDAKEFKISDNVKNLNQYRYTFTYDKDSDNYIFNMIELVK